VVTEVAKSNLPERPLSSLSSGPQHLLTLSSVEDDGLGEELQVVWELEPGRQVIEKVALPGPTGLDGPERLDAFLDKLIAKWSHFAVVVTVVPRRNSYIVRFAAGGGPYGEKVGTESKLLPAKRLKAAGVTVNNASFCKALRLPGALAESAQAAATATVLLQEDDDSDEALLAEAAEVEEDEEVPVTADPEYESADEDDGALVAGTTRGSFPVTLFNYAEAEYLFCVTDDNGVVTEAR